MTAHPGVTRVRHEIRRRLLTVARVQELTPTMRRVVLTGPALEGFTSLGFDDHVKLFFAPQGAGVQGESRDFTPRRHDAARGELWLDFFLHEAGPAAEWGAQAKPGDILDIGGPRGSMILDTAGIDLHLLVGDETAWPAICRRLEELPSGTRALVVLETGTAATWPLPASSATVQAIQVMRGSETDPPASGLIEALRALEFPAPRTYAWVALEFHATRAVRQYLRTERGFAKEWIKAAAYWNRGPVAADERIEDD